MNVIFLDIDGVLNSDEWNASHQQEINDGILVDSDKIRLLQQIVEQTDAKLVLHSGWRFWFDEKMLPQRKEAKIFLHMLQSCNLSIWDRTPDRCTDEIKQTKQFSRVKGQEIKEWLAKHPDTEQWIVLDDIALPGLDQNHQVKTNTLLGLSKEDVLQSIHQLTKIDE